MIGREYLEKGGEVSVYNLRKGDKVKTRKGDIETILRKTGSGSYETLENDYSHSPESLEFISRPSRKMAKGGAMEHMIMEGDSVKAVYKNMLVIESRYGDIYIVDLDVEPFASRIVVEEITGKNSVESAKAEIDSMVARQPSKMAKGGNVFYEGQSVMFPTLKNTRVLKSTEKLFNQYANKELVIGKIESGKPYDNAEAFVKSTGEKVPFTFVLNPKYIFPYNDSGMMAKGGKIREWDDVLVISKNKLGMVEAIGDNIYYVTTPFGETIEATMDDLQKIVSFKEGGDLKIGEIAMIAKENKATGDEVVKKISAGADVEMEHTEDRKVAMRIASDHLKEDFNYYEKLRKAGL